MQQYHVLKPDCYRQFSCKGNACRFNCCSEWRITMSKDEYRKIKKSGAKTDGLICQVDQKRRTSTESYEMALDENGVCPYLSEEKLCGLQCKYGPEILSETCMNYPRIYHRYLDKLEAGLSLGCERVLEILLEEKKLDFTNTTETFPDQFHFNTGIDAKRRRKSSELIYYYDIQALCLSLLQAEDAAMEDRLILLGMALQHVNELAKSGKGREIPGYIHDFLDSIDGTDAGGQMQQLKGENLGVFYHNLLIAGRYVLGNEIHYDRMVKKIGEKLKVDIKREIERTEFITVTDTVHSSVEEYKACQENFKRFIQGKEYYMENLMVGFMLQCNFPYYKPDYNIWQNYIYFAWTYSMLKFTLTMTLEPDSTDEDFIDCCAIMFRKLGHNPLLYENLIKAFELNNNDTLAHMVVLLKS